jgi:anti-anti-sigma factor
MGSLERSQTAQGRIEATHDASGAPVLKLIGEIDISNAHALGDALAALITVETTQLILDLSALEFMDSSGIAMLLQTAGQVPAIEVRNPSNVVRRIIECTGLTEILRIAP